MKNFLVFLIFVMGEITVGEAMRCQQCKAFGAEDCSGDFTECENKDDFCIQSIEYNIVGGDKKTTVSRGCKNIPMLCQGTLTLHTGQFELIIHHTCCYEDDCNTDEIEMPKLNTTENGLFCKSCFAEASYQCEEYETMACTGNEEECLEYNGEGTRPCEVEKLYAFAGCASKGASKFGYDALVGACQET